MEEIKMKKLGRVYESLKMTQNFLKPALPFVNSHLTEFFASSYWETLLPPLLRQDLERKSLDEVKACMKDFASGKWEQYESSASLTEESNFQDAVSVEDLIVCCGRLRLKHRKLSRSFKELKVRDIAVDQVKTVEPLKFDVIMSAKKTHEVEILSDAVAKMASAVRQGSCSDGRVESLVDLGSGKGYLSSYLTLLYGFKVLAVDSCSLNTIGCETRSKKMEKVWCQLVRRAIERRDHGVPTKRGKKRNSKKPSSDSPSKESDEESSSDPLQLSQSENKLLKTVTQFVTEDCDLGELLRDHFPLTPVVGSNNHCNDEFGIVGLHTCGNLGVASLEIYLANPSAKFLLNVPCCYHLLEENYLFYPEKCFDGSKLSRRNEGKMVESILNPTFPLSNVYDTPDHNRFCLGRNARMMCAYSVERMVNQEQGLDMHPSIVNRSILQSLIKKYLLEVYENMDDYEHKVGKIGDKCRDFKEYFHQAMINLKLDSVIQLSGDEAEDFYNSFSVEERVNLHKYYLLRSLFAPIVEEVILLDRLGFLLEHDSVEDAEILEVFDPSVSPRCHAIVSWKK